MSRETPGAPILTCRSLHSVILLRLIVELGRFGGGEGGGEVGVLERGGRGGAEKEGEGDGLGADGRSGELG